MAGRARAATIYGVHPGVAMVRTWIDTLKAKSGRSLEEWLRFVEAKGPKGEKARRDWLKEKQGLGTTSAWWIAARSVGADVDDADPEAYLEKAVEYVEAMYAGKKAGLRPIHDRLLELAKGLGPDVKACPCKTIVPIYRKNVIAEIKPTTLTRIDFGLALRDVATPARLIDTGGFAKKDRITRRIELRSVDEIDATVEKWLRRAYDMNAD
jgi:hypothetical protein